MVDNFWANHFTPAEVGRKLGFSRQNVCQRIKRGSVPHVVGPEGKIGVPIDWVQESINHRDGTKFILPSDVMAINAFCGFIDAMNQEESDAAQ